MANGNDKSEIRSNRDLNVWQDAMALAEASYEMTRAFPKEEMFGMTSQIRRSSASIAANVAEGHGRELTDSFIQFLRISQGSLKELETHVILANRVGLLASNNADSLLIRTESLGKSLRSLIRSLQAREKQ
ncbi:MAG: four helix bundle protein [Beijerinckiaceae bacterium]